MRKVINLPDDIPPELLRPAREGDDDSIMLAAWKAFLSFFSFPPLEIGEEAAKPILAHAAVLFPAFRAPATKKRPGRPRGSRKRDDSFLLEFANKFDIMKWNNKGPAPLSDPQLLTQLKKHNESIANTLRVGYRGDIKFRRVLALISKGRKLRIGLSPVLCTRDGRPFYLLHLPANAFEGFSCQDSFERWGE